MIPAIASATPVSVRLLGRRRVVAHSQPTTRIGAVYSSQRDRTVLSGLAGDAVVIAVPGRPVIRVALRDVRPPVFVRLRAVCVRSAPIAVARQTNTAAIRTRNILTPLWS